MKFPDPFDLALMKISRNADVDREDVRYLHKTYKLKPEILLKRLKEELLPIYVGSQRDLVLKYLFNVETLFGTSVSVAHEKNLP